MSGKNHSSIGIHHPEGEAPRAYRRLGLLRRGRNGALVAMGLLGAGAALVIGMRVLQAHSLEEAARQQSILHVKVVTPQEVSGGSLLSLPGTLQGFIEAPIYARVGGYVARWYRDIGDPVRQGDLLAQLDVPELNQQLNEAKAAQRQAATNLQLAQTTFDRWEALRKRDAVSQQEYDEKRSAQAVAVAAEASATATVRRLEEQLGYSRIVAPFSGIVTRRNVDIGNLVDAGGGTKSLFTLAKSDPLRVYVYVPQNYASQVKVGDKAEVSLKEMPEAKFSGAIVRTARAIDPVTRTLQVEVDLPNGDGRLLPGAYVQVGIRTRGEAASSTLSLPGNTLLFRPEGPRVGVVDDAGRVQLRPVAIGRELGINIELKGGVAKTDRIILNPPDSLSNGDPVSIVAPAPEAGAGRPAPRSGS
ncbi:MAG: efflux RND transporter periplasmic adaptor subunit [Betaproteobacteria bacterium]|nr:efflux RND transporter periplasmic adaptor subunit [Betaproteobacteria bacterium]